LCQKELRFKFGGGATRNVKGLDGFSGLPFMSHRHSSQVTGHSVSCNEGSGAASI
jgi:hypothetical protein